jgi:hypothetical protein
MSKTNFWTLYAVCLIAGILFTGYSCWMFGQWASK